MVMAVPLDTMLHAYVGEECLRIVPFMLWSSVCRRGMLENWLMIWLLFVYGSRRSLNIGTPTHNMCNFSFHQHLRYFCEVAKGHQYVYDYFNITINLYIHHFQKENPKQNKKNYWATYPEKHVSSQMNQLSSVGDA